MAIIKKSQIKERVNELDEKNSIGSISEGLGTALERRVDELLTKAIARAKANKRRTLRPEDI